VLNAANETAVEAFHDRKLGFMGIPHVIKKTLDEHEAETVSTLQTVRRIDHWAREYARSTVRELEYSWPGQSSEV
jgi:1-deoxy-D-xylulose-5-phosphate reductoisomerase